MCGRFNLLASATEICAEFDLDHLADVEKRYNISPGQPILNITQLPDGVLHAAYVHWGLVPSWAKDPSISAHLINARAETLPEKPSFRAAYQKRRCLIPTTGFYEWQKTPQGKQAYHISRADQHLFAFAGLWEYWEHQGETLYSCTIITTAANSLMQPIHERMPVIIAQPNYRLWLDSQQSSTHLQALLQEDAYNSTVVNFPDSSSHNGA